MSTTEVTPVPETLPASPTEATNLSEWTPEQRQHWRDTGEVPKPKAASAPAKKSDSGQEPDKAAPASEPGTGQEKKTQTAAERKAQLQKEIQELTAERNRLRAAKPDVKQEAEPSPAAQPEKKAATPPKPTMDDKDDKGQPKYKTWKEFEDAKDEWIEARAVEKAEAKIRESRQKETAEQAAKANSEAWKAKVDAAAEKVPDFAEVVNKAIADKHPIFDNKLRGSALENFIYTKAENGPAILHHLIKNEAEFDRIIAIKDFFEFSRAMYTLDDSFKSDEGPKKKEAPVQPVTKAPKPISEVGGRETTADDPVVAAARSTPGKLNRQFKNAADREYLARKARTG